MIDFSKMNEAQKNAVLHGEGPLLVLAGPGSGKTFTITSRLAYLMEHYRIAPEKILSISFTREAALSMQERFKLQVYPSNPSLFVPVNFGTFHSIFYQIIRNSYPSKDFRILTDSEKRSMILPVLKKCKDEACQEAGCVLGAISYYKNTGKLEQAAQQLSGPVREAFPAIIKEYEKARLGTEKLDFDDMLFMCLNILKEDKRTRYFWQERFRYIMIDEFQDINPIQYQVIRLLCAQPYNIFAVGDDDQSIYGFRGSEPSLMRQFLTDYPQAGQILLSVNYRSHPAIVESSLKVIQCNTNRFDKELTANITGTDSDKARNRVKLKDFDSKDKQYDYLTACFSEDMGNGKLEQCAVLFRTNMQMQLLASRLKRENIPFTMKEKSICIYDHFIGEDIAAFLSFALGNRQRQVFLHIMNKPLRRIPREALTQDHVDFGQIRSYMDRMETGSCKDRVLVSLDRLERDMNRMGSSKPYLGMQLLRKSIGYELYLQEKAGTDEEKLSEWMDILDYITQEARSFSTYREWMEYWKRYREEFASGKEMSKKSGVGTSGHEMDKKDNEKKWEENQNKAGVRLMTAHGSKGLEFRKVYIPDINEGIYPHGKMIPEEAVEEERRIFYVAMTRAKEELELLWVSGSKERPRNPSRFLGPLLDRREAR